MIPSPMCSAMAPKIPWRPAPCCPCRRSRPASVSPKVSFSYSLTSERQLDQFSVSLAAGQTIGLVGPSGSGKSTLVQLLDGLYKADEGRIYIEAPTSARCR